MRSWLKLKKLTLVSHLEDPLMYITRVIFFIWYIELINNIILTY